MTNLTIERNSKSHVHDKRFKPIIENIQRKPKAIWLIDISSLAIRQQHRIRYMYIRKGVKLEIDFIVLYNYQRKKGYYRFISHKAKPKDIQDFIKAIGIDENIIYHDKGFLFKFGIQYHTQRVKQRIEHIFGFKRYVYKAYQKGLIKSAKGLFEIYRAYLNKMNLKEV